MFWTGLLVGLIVGAASGVLFTGLLCAGSNSDDHKGE
nr:hypothetical protein DGKKSRWO_DGKKSRWO_CDS_0094 [uncultured phage]CAI9752271.1 hypothetical protein CVNMHQAP_CVNMHQAP_CDS_0094 [uncultured phage]